MFKILYSNLFTLLFCVSCSCRATKCMVRKVITPTRPNKICTPGTYTNTKTLFRVNRCVLNGYEYRYEQEVHCPPVFSWNLVETRVVQQETRDKTIKLHKHEVLHFMWASGQMRSSQEHERDSLQDGFNRLFNSSLVSAWSDSHPLQLNQTTCLKILSLVFKWCTLYQPDDATDIWDKGGEESKIDSSGRPILPYQSQCS